MKSMVFIDYQNFNIGMRNYLLSIKENLFNINLSTLAQELNSQLLIKSCLMKTYLFAYKPCDELLKLNSYNNYYNWLSSIKNKPYFEVIEGTQEIRKISKDIS